MFKIDINADVGEGSKNESMLFPYISSCNIACGGHAGNRRSMKSTVLLAIKNKIKIGAHPSFPDKENFGRKEYNLSKINLKISITNQILSLIKICDFFGEKINHIKPHGSLYNMSFYDLEIANIIIDVITELKYPVKIYAQPMSILSIEAVKKNITVSNEAFIDRHYNSDNSLVDRNNPNSLITNSFEINQRVLKLVLSKQIIAMNGDVLTLNPQTLCIHSDTPNSFQIIKLLSKCLLENNIKVG
jgi:UPF0271 protein